MTVAGFHTRFPTTVQTRFDELDVFLSYKFSLGPIDITLGDIAFFISRRATTYEQDVLPPRFDGLLNLGWFIPPTCTRVRRLSPDPTIEEEVFDRLYITLSTTKISKDITPSITYYQTIYSWGSEPTHDGTLFYAPVPPSFPRSVHQTRARSTSGMRHWEVILKEELTQGFPSQVGSILIRTGLFR